MELALLQAYLGIGSLAVATIYLGSKRSVRSHPLLKSPKARKEYFGDDDIDTETDDIERLSSGDAIMFPILGSIVLFSLYLAFKYLDAEMLKKIFNAYFVIMGSLSLARAMSIFISFSMPSVAQKSRSLIDSMIPLPKEDEMEEEVEQKEDDKETAESKQKDSTAKPTAKQVEQIRSFISRYGLSAPLSALISFYHFYYNSNWIIGNLIALSAAYNALNMLRIDSFKTGNFLLAGLFIYDIYWVFGTKVMVTVATSFDGPIKILWPKSFDLSNPQFTMLGLGDIVVPGIFVALAHRFDYVMANQRYQKKNGNVDVKDSNILPMNPFIDYPKPYFYATFISYILGLFTTIVVMHTFKAAQPALLYLSPACILSALFTALNRGEFSDLMSYDDGAGGEEDKSKEEVKEEEDKEESKKTQ